MSQKHNAAATGHRRHGWSTGVGSPVSRVERYEGIRSKPIPTTLNATERLVFDVLDDEWVPAREIAGFAGITVGECRRALATLRTLGMAELKRPRGHNPMSVWRRV